MNKIELLADLEIIEIVGGIQRHGEVGRFVRLINEDYGNPRAALLSGEFDESIDTIKELLLGR